MKNTVTVLVLLPFFLLFERSALSSGYDTKITCNNDAGYSFEPVNQPLSVLYRLSVPGSATPMFFELAGETVGSSVFGWVENPDGTKVSKIFFELQYDSIDLNQSSSKLIIYQSESAWVMGYDEGKDQLQETIPLICQFTQ